MTGGIPEDAARRAQSCSHEKVVRFHWKVAIVAGGDVDGGPSRPVVGV